MTVTYTKFNMRRAQAIKGPGERTITKDHQKLLLKEAKANERRFDGRYAQPAADVSIVKPAEIDNTDKTTRRILRKMQRKIRWKGMMEGNDGGSK